LIGVVDWGCDFAHPDFRHPDGTTRLLALWDQRPQTNRTAPVPYGYGVVHAREAINHALKTSDPYATLGYHPADSDTGQGSHGTHVLGIAAGNGRAGGPPGVAPEADLVFVHSSTLASEGPDRLGDSVTLLEAIDFIKGAAEDRPWVINLSMGRHGEPHDGTTLVEQGLDQILRAAPGRAIVQSTGNYFDRRIHSSGQLRPADERQLVWEVAEIDPTPNQLEVWYSGLDTFEVEVIGPDECLRQRAALEAQTAFMLNGVEVGKIYHRRAEPNNLSNHIEIFLHRGAPAGEWIVTIKGKDVVDGRYHAWIERDAACPRCQSNFSAKDAVSISTTGTICNGFRTIAVGAYNLHSPRRELAPFSSSGPTRDGRLKPDLVAPGVRVLAARSAPRNADDEKPLLTRMSGTSMASPYVAGTVALMFEVAGRPLRIEETHNLLLASTTKPDFVGENIARIGSGYCEISRAVEAARSVNRPLTAQSGESKSEQIMETEFDESYGELREDEPGERETKRNFVLISGGPGPYNTRDIEHDKSWANYVTPPLLMTDTAKKLATFSAKDEEIWWFVYQPAYVTRWSDDARSKTAARQAEVARVKKLGFSSYVELIKQRAKDRGWNLRWLAEADDLWDKLKTFSKGSISRVWYWGHASDDLWLSVAHDPSTDVAIAPAAGEIITVSSIDPALKDRFQTGSLSRIHRFVGCNTEDFAKAWSKVYGVWSEGVVGKVNFSSIHSTGGEPCLSDSAGVKYFNTSGTYDSSEDSRTTAKKCSDVPHEIFEQEIFEVVSVENKSWPTFEMNLLETADEVIRSQAGLRASPASMLSETIGRVIGANALPGNKSATTVSPAAIFESLALGKENEALREQIEQLFEVVARPRTSIAGALPGDIFLRHPLGEGAFTHAAILTTGEALRQENLSSLGIIPESARAGYYCEVVEGGRYPHHQRDRFARRIGDQDGLLSHDSLILRLRRNESAESLSENGLALRVQYPEETYELAELAENNPTFEVGHVIPTCNGARCYVRMPITVESPVLGASGRVIQRERCDTLAQVETKRLPLDDDPAFVFITFGDLIRSFSPANALWRATASGELETALDLIIYYPASAANSAQLAGGGPFPLAIICHGNHNAFETTSFGSGTSIGSVDGKDHRQVTSVTFGPEVTSHLGYCAAAQPTPPGVAAAGSIEYLQEELARHGIISVSVSTNGANVLDLWIETRADYVLKALAEMRLFAGNSTSPFYRKINFDKVAFVGHSRGGDAVLRAAHKNKAATPRSNVRAVVQIAPTDISGIANGTAPAGAAPARTTFITTPMRVSPSLDVMYLCIYGSRDGDVSGWGDQRTPTEGTGFRHYDRSGAQRAFQFWHGATHNQFNRFWLNSEEDLAHTTPAAVMGRLEQEMRTSEAVGGWLRFVLNNEGVEADRFNGRVATTIAPTFPCVSMWKFGRRLKTIDRFDDDRRSDRNTLGGRNIAPTSGLVDEVSLANENPVGAGDTAFQFMHIDPVLRASLPTPRSAAAGTRGTSGVWRSEIPAADQDFSIFTLLTLRVTKRFDEAEVAAATTPAAKTALLPTITVTVRDRSGGHASAPAASSAGVVSLPDIRWIPPAAGQPTDLTKFHFETWQVPLASFAAANLHRVSSVEIEMAGLVGQSIYVDTISLVHL
jgi:hypothetical protein